MSKNTVVLCDHCRADITYSGASDAYRIVLECELVPTHPEVRVQHDVSIRPPLIGARHFCSVRCLKFHVQNL